MHQELTERDNIARMTKALAEMEILLDEHGNRWATVVGEILRDWLAARTCQERSLVVRQLARVQGTLGLSDQYFHKNGQILRDETRKLSALLDESNELVRYFVR